MPITIINPEAIESPAAAAPAVAVVEAPVRRRIDRGPDAPTTTALVEAIKDAGQDFEWYPTTKEMLEAIAMKLPEYGTKTLMDIGAGDGRALIELDRLKRTIYATREIRRRHDYYKSRKPEELADDRTRLMEHGGFDELYSIEKAAVLAQAQPERITPVGTDFWEQNLACLEVDVIFCNPPYSEFEAWANTIIRSGYAHHAYLVIPQRWKESKLIKEALEYRGAKASVIYSGDFNNAERQARAKIDIVHVDFPGNTDWGGRRGSKADPFDTWFNENITTFDKTDDEEVPEYEQKARELAKVRHLTDIGDMVEAYNEEYALMEKNYKAIFELDYALLKELNVSKDQVRDGIKKRMAGLKNKYWTLLFERLDTITSRLSTATKQRFLEKLTNRTSVAFTVSNAYTIALWAIKHANKYFDEQVVTLFRELATFDGVLKYKSNQKTWAADGWRFHNHRENYTHYALDYRIVVSSGGLRINWDGKADGKLADRGCDLIADIIAVLGNLGFATNIRTRKELDDMIAKGLHADYRSLPARERHWVSNVSQEFLGTDGKLLFDVKAFKNGNLHIRFRPEAIKAINIEAGRLLGWLKDKSDVVTEMGYSAEDAEKYFGANQLLTPSSVKLLAAPQKSEAA